MRLVIEIQCVSDTMSCTLASGYVWQAQVCEIIVFIPVIGQCHLPKGRQLGAEAAIALPPTEFPARPMFERFVVHVSDPCIVAVVHRRLSIVHQ